MACNERKEERTTTSLISQLDTSANGTTQTNIVDQISHAKPKRNLLKRLPPEVRDRIFEIVYSNKKTLVLVRDNNKASERADNVNWNSFAGYHVLRPDISHKKLLDDKRTSIQPKQKTTAAAPNNNDKDRSPLTSLLLVDKQTHLEALPHLYGSCTFRFDQLQATKLFATRVGKLSLECIRKVEVYIPALAERHSEEIVVRMPNIEQLTARFPHRTIELDEFSRNREFENELLGFSGLEKVMRLGVECPRLRQGGGPGPVGFPRLVFVRSDATTDALEEMIRTGDCMALSRAGRANPESRSRWV